MATTFDTNIVNIPFTMNGYSVKNNIIQNKGNALAQFLTANGTKLYLIQIICRVSVYNNTSNTQFIYCTERINNANFFVKGQDVAPYSFSEFNMDSTENTTRTVDINSPWILSVDKGSINSFSVQARFQLRGLPWPSKGDIITHPANDSSHTYYPVGMQWVPTSPGRVIVPGYFDICGKTYYVGSTNSFIDLDQLRGIQDQIKNLAL